MSVPSTSLMFVYGSLRRGSANPHAAFLHIRCRMVGPGIMAGRLYRNGSVHGAVYEEGCDSPVLGDVLELPAEKGDDLLTSLDRYEGIGSGLPKPHSFRRETVKVQLDGGPRVDCWAWLYTLPVKGCTWLRHGDALKD